MSSQSSVSLPPKQDRKLKDAALALEICLSERGDWLAPVPDLKHMKHSKKIAKMMNAVLVLMIFPSFVPIRDSSRLIIPLANPKMSDKLQFVAAFGSGRVVETSDKLKFVGHFHRILGLLSNSPAVFLTAALLHLIFPGPHNARPGFTPVCSPSLMTCAPLTNTCFTPTAN